MTYLASLSETMADKVNGYTILHTLKEVHELIARNKEANRLIMRTDFVSANFTPSGIVNFLQNVKQVNRNLIVELEDTTNGMVPATFKKKLRQVRTADEMFLLMNKYPSEFMDTVQTLVANEDIRNTELLTASSTVSQLHAVIDEIKKENENLSHQLKIEQENKAQAQSRLNVITSRLEYQYGKHVDPDKIFNVDSNDYDRVIYFKECSRVQYMDSLVYYLAEILKILYSMPARKVVIEGYHAYGKVPMYPEYAPHYGCTEKDILSGDILMLGFQSGTMSNILRNPNRVSILIILDRGGYSVPHVIGNNVEYFYTASDPKDIPAGVPIDRQITYNDNGNNLYIPYFEGFAELDKSEKITAYSTSTIIKRIIKLLERR